MERVEAPLLCGFKEAAGDVANGPICEAVQEAAGLAIAEGMGPIKIVLTCIGNFVSGIEAFTWQTTR